MKEMGHIRLKVKVRGSEERDGPREFVRLFLLGSLLGGFFLKRKQP